MATQRTTGWVKAMPENTRDDEHDQPAETPGGANFTTDGVPASISDDADTNDMTQRLESAFLATISHELRTFAVGWHSYYSMSTIQGAKLSRGA